MKVTQEKLPASQVGLEIELPAEMSKQAYEKKVREFSRTINIPGFRKGKVPRHVLIQRLGAMRLKMTVLEDLIDSGIRQAIDQEKIEALGNFQLRSSFDELAERFEPGQPLTFSAAVDVPPDVSLEEYKGLQVKAEEIKYEPLKVDDVLEDYQNRTATLIPVEDRAVQMGDIAIVDFSGTYVPSEGEEPIEIEGGSAQDFQLEMKEGQFIAGFVEGVVGMNIEEEKELNLQFPDDYPQENLAGKPATFSISLKELKEKELPELDDDFAQEVSEFETLQELRDTLEKRYKDEAEQQTKQNVNAAMFEELLKKISVELPESMIKREVDLLVTQTVMRLENQGLDIRKTLSQELVEGMRERARPEAETRLKRTLALGEIAKQESIEVGKEELEEKIKTFMESYGDQDVDPDRVRSVLTDELLEEKVLAWLEENGTVELVPEGTLTKEEESAGELAADDEPLADEPVAKGTDAEGADTTESVSTDDNRDGESAIVDVDAVEVDEDSEKDSSEPEVSVASPDEVKEESKEAPEPASEALSDEDASSKGAKSKAADASSSEKKKKSTKSTRTKKTASRSKKTKETTEETSDSDSSDASE
ncbi:MAG: trigger factor [Cyanobacteria bacterium J06626_14]